MTTAQWINNALITKGNKVNEKQRKSNKESHKHQEITPLHQNKIEKKLHTGTCFHATLVLEMEYEGFTYILKLITCF